ncbi:MAG: hypothetical protein P1V18_04490 [Candidatus Gracilibacteria bacterium]|nr:hypothetical protein [Candidatus Gracilibacteria bacterium]
MIPSVHAPAIPSQKTRNSHLREKHHPWTSADDVYFESHLTDRTKVIRELITALPEQAFCFLNESALFQRVRLLQDHFLPGSNNRRIAYAVKANPRRRILEILNRAGLESYDCASVEEIQRVKAINNNAEVFFNHPIKKRRDIEAASLMGVDHFTAQTQNEIEKILSSVVPNNESAIEVALRLITHNPSAAINLSEKFGTYAACIYEMAEWIKKSSDSQIGLSIHTGSQNTHPSQFAEGIFQMMSVAEQIGGVSTLNVGGGLPANYHKGEKYNLEHFLAVISKTLRSSLSKVLKPNGKVIIEPGRGIIAEAVDMVIPILSVEKRGHSRLVYIDDGVFTSFSDAVIHHWKYNIQTFSPHKEKKWENSSSAVVFGRTCDSGDCLGDVMLPNNITEGDYFLLRSAGAYMDSQSTSFNGFHPPQYVVYNPIH